RDDPHAAGRGSRDQLAEQIARSEIRTLVVIRNGSRVKRDDAATVQEQRVQLERSPVCDPRGDVQRQRVALIEVELAAASHRRVPWLAIGDQGSRQGVPARQSDQRSGRTGYKLPT